MEERIIQVLLIEDNPGDARLLQELLLEVESVPFQLKHVDCLSAGLQGLQNHNFDVILLDLSLPDAHGFDSFAKLYSSARQVPIVVITGLNDEQLAFKAVQAGAQDYLVKGQVSGDLLVRAMRYAIERKRSEQKIRQQAALLDIATDAILVWDLESRLLFWNKAAEHLYGWQAAEVLGKRADQILQSIAAQFDQAQASLIEQGEWSGELTQLTKTQHEITVASRWTLMRDEDDTPKSVLVVNTDITEKKKLEAQFLRAQRMESLGTLASGLAHDLNNILTPVLATAQLLQLKWTDTSERNQQLLQMLEVNARRGATLVKQVLSFARGVEGERALLSLKDLIAEIRQIIAETFPKSIEIETYISTELWMTKGDITQLHQVLMNLCINARDAMPQGGQLTIAAENLVVDEVFVRSNLEAKAGCFVGITVADTGIGMSAETLDRIFEPFFTTKDFGKGTGLGLSTVLGIVKSHGGFVSVSSEVGKGTQFKLYLPAVIATELPEQNSIELLAGNGELVLVVDDEIAICESNKALLEAYNYRVLIAKNGIEAVALYTQHQDQIKVA
ncbi:MAG TPA: response regulator, partial [Allocoleopsis sp.]